MVIAFLQTPVAVNGGRQVEAGLLPVTYYLCREFLKAGFAFASGEIA